MLGFKDILIFRNEFLLNNKLLWFYKHKKPKKKFNTFNQKFVDIVKNASIRCDFLFWNSEMTVLISLKKKIKCMDYVVLKLFVIGNYPNVKIKWNRETEKIYQMKHLYFCIQRYDYTVVHHNRILTDIQARN